MKKHSTNLGFTLIEILVVLFIISIVSGVAVLSFSGNDDRKLKLLANEISQMLALAQDRAILQSEVIGLFIADHHFSFMTLEKKEKDYVWRDIEDQILYQHQFPGNVDIKVSSSNLKVDDDDAPTSPQILVYMNRDFTPFTLYIGKRDQAPRFAIMGDANGDLQTKALS